jgi:hypothetical protein
MRVRLTTSALRMAVADPTPTLLSMGKGSMQRPRKVQMSVDPDKTMTFPPCLSMWAIAAALDEDDEGIGTDTAGATEDSLAETGVLGVRSIAKTSKYRANRKSE